MRAAAGPSPLLLTACPCPLHARAGSLKNGIESKDWGEYAYSIGFTKVPDPAIGTTTSTGAVNTTGTDGTGSGTETPPIPPGGGSNTGTRTGSGTVRFERPMANGLPLDYCREFRTNCGAAAAAYFCQSLGYTDQASFAMLDGTVDRTYLPATRETCILNVNNNVCNTFETIDCVGGPAGEGKGSEI